MIRSLVLVAVGGALFGIGLATGDSIDLGLGIVGLFAAAFRESHRHAATTEPDRLDE